MRKRPTIQTMTFQCPHCGYRQKGYFNQCPIPDCDNRRMQEFIATMQRKCGYDESNKRLRANPAI